MKKIILGLMIIGCLSACKKEEMDPPSPSWWVGKYEFVADTSLGPNPVSDFLLTCSEDSMYFSYNNGITTSWKESIITKSDEKIVSKEVPSDSSKMVLYHNMNLVAYTGQEHFPWVIFRVN